MPLSVKDKKRFPLLKLPFLLITVLILAALALLAWFLLLQRQNIEPLDFTMPGSSMQSNGRFAVNESVVRPVFQRSEQLLLNSDRMWYSWYQLAGRLDQPPARISDEVIVADQLLYGRYLIEQQEEKSFLAWWAAFQDVFMTEQDALHPLSSRQTDQPVLDNLGLLRLLGQSCTLWPDQERLDAITSLSDQILAAYTDGLPADREVALPTPGPTLDPAATPTPWPTSEPTPDPDLQPRKTVVAISSLDLFSMQQLASIDSRWQAHYERVLPVIEQAYLHDQLPLFALAYDESSGSYIQFSGELAVIDLEQALQTLLHLAEIDRAPERSIAWLKDQLYNQSALYKNYNIVQGTPATADESVAGYAMTARIARMVDDQTLYDQAVERLLWHQATSPTSAAFSAIFRQEDTGEIRIWAKDNLYAVLSMH